MLSGSHIYAIRSSRGTFELTSPIFFASWQLSFGRYNAPKFERFCRHEILSLVYCARYLLQSSILQTKPEMPKCQKSPRIKLFWCPNKSLSFTNFNNIVLVMQFQIQVVYIVATDFWRLPKRFLFGLTSLGVVILSRISNRQQPRWKLPRNLEFFQRL